MRELLKSKHVEYEKYCNAGHAQWDEAKALLEEIKSLYKENGLEFCAHNAAYAGSERYAKYLNPNLKGFITRSEYKKLNLDQIMNFENLTEFPFKV